MSAIRHGELVATAAEFLAGFNVTHYFTLTYGTRRGESARMATFREWVDALERELGRPLAWFRADEMRHYSGLGFPAIPPHHHGLLMDARGLSCKAAEGFWKSLAGDALVEEYRTGGGAIPYCLKHAFSICGDWDIGGKPRPKRTRAALWRSRGEDLK